MSRNGRNGQIEPVEEVEYDEGFASLLPGELTAAADSFPAAAPDLVRVAAVRGRRMRRVRVAQVTAATVAVATLSLVGVGVVASTGGGSSPGSVERARSVEPAASTAPAAPPMSTPKPTLPGVSGDEMAATLKSLMPHGGSVTHASGSGTPTPANGGKPLTARLTYGKGSGISGVDVSVARLAPGRPDDSGYRLCLPIEVRPYDVCTTKTLPDGSQLSVTKSFTYPNSKTGQKLWYAVLTTRDNVQIVVEEFGGGGEKETTSSVQPLLSTDELSAVAKSTQWDKAIASIPVVADPTGTPEPPSDPGVPSGVQMAALLKTLLAGHAGARTDWSTQDGLVQVVYDDGHGRTAIEVDVQEGMGDVASTIMSCSDSRGGSCTMSTLPDGTAVRTSKEPSEKGGKAVVWQVDILRPDGRRVLAREINSYAESGPVTRPEPALKMDQLRDIALSPKWLAQAN